jgi:hypothetical protein
MPVNAGVVRKWNNRDDGPGGKTVFLTNETVPKLPKPLDDDDRSLIENGWLKASQPQWALGHPPQKTERAAPVHVFFVLVSFPLATAYRLVCERADIGEEPVGWQRWRRHPIQQHRDKVIVLAQGHSGIFHVAEYSLLRGQAQRVAPGDRDPSRRAEEIQARRTGATDVGTSGGQF